jgi:hypothetical protein
MEEAVSSAHISFHDWKSLAPVLLMRLFERRRAHLAKFLKYVATIFFVSGVANRLETSYPIGSLQLLVPEALLPQSG